jgi:hypothetical protein
MCGHMAFLDIHQYLENMYIVSDSAGIGIKLENLSLQKIFISIFKTSLAVG